TPSSVRASLSRVWEAGSRKSVSRRLSRISACESLATPWVTLTRSNTTRRSAPMTRSRLRRPTSKSISTTFLPLWARTAPRAAVEVVFPTPPLPDVTTTTLPMHVSPMLSVEGRDQNCAFVQIGLYRRAARGRLHVLRDAIPPIHRQKLGFVPPAEDARLAISRGAGDGAPAQCAI